MPLDFSHRIGADDDKRVGDKPAGRGVKKSQPGQRGGGGGGGFDLLGGFQSDPKTAKKLDLKLGSSMNPIQGIIQGLAFQNKSPGRGTLAPYRAKDLSGMQYPGTERFGQPGQSIKGPSFMPEMSDYLREFIFSLMKNRYG